MAHRNAGMAGKTDGSDASAVKLAEAGRADKCREAENRWGQAHVQPVPRDSRRPATRCHGVYAEANNLLNQPLRYYQGTKDRTMQAEYYGVKVNAGVKINF